MSWIEKAKFLGCSCTRGCFARMIVMIENESVLPPPASYEPWHILVLHQAELVRELPAIYWNLLAKLVAFGLW